MSEIAEPRLFDNRTPEGVIAAAHERYGPFIHRVCLFSGGNDSLAVAHRCRDHYDTLVWVDTGTAVPGVAEFVAEAAEWLEKPLRVYQAPQGAYRRIVLGGVDPKTGNDKEPLGFPGPMQHTRCYVNLKEAALESMLRDFKKGHERTARVLALTGIRRSESLRRKSRAELTKRGSLVFCNPIIDWSALDLTRYRVEQNFIESDVAALLHRSGECNCGAYATKGEREMLRSLWPEWFEERIGSIEREAEERGLECAVWGSGRDLIDARKLERKAGEMCSDCQLRIEAA
jgi:3'-phosphoadenosine 5'-phosphosulfate sulfotransferase (PAPS reductase)/FAD synthetase